MQSWVLPTYHYTFCWPAYFWFAPFLSLKRICTLVFPKKEIFWEINSFSGWATNIQNIFLHLHQLAYYCTLAGKINFPCLVGTIKTPLYIHCTLSLAIDEKEDLNTTTHILLYKTVYKYHRIFRRARRLRSAAERPPFQFGFLSFLGG